MNHHFSGKKIIEDINMVIDGEPYQVDRSWKENIEFLLSEIDRLQQEKGA
jgi:hypothetical protein